MTPKILYPVAAMILLVIGWQAGVEYFAVPKFILPSPSMIYTAFLMHFDTLVHAAMKTLSITLIALLCALVTGVLLALAFSISKTFEATFYPFAVVAQVTPIVSIAPLILIWVGIDHVDRALVIIAWLAAFFPILANMSAGLKAVDPLLSDLFKLYDASRMNRFRYLLWPTALPYLLASIKISAGLALIGAVVAEFVAGSGEGAGIAWTLLEAGNRLQTEKMFAALILLGFMGVCLFYLFDTLERRLLKNR